MNFTSLGWKLLVVLVDRFGACLQWPLSFPVSHSFQGVHPWAKWRKPSILFALRDCSPHRKCLQALERCAVHPGWPPVQLLVIPCASVSLLRPGWGQPILQQLLLILFLELDKPWTVTAVHCDVLFIVLELVPGTAAFKPSSNWWCSANFLNSGT